MRSHPPPAPTVAGERPVRWKPLEPEVEVSEVRLPEPPATVAEFARTHRTELVRFAYLIAGNRTQAEDLVQDVLLAMHRRFADELTIDAPVAYARRAIANGQISWARRRSNHELPTDRIPDRPITDVDSAAMDPLWPLVNRLPRRQRVVLVMRYYLDSSDAEIAATLGCRRGTVRSLASRALADLRTSSDIQLLMEEDPS